MELDHGLSYILIGALMIWSAPACNGSTGSTNSDASTDDSQVAICGNGTVEGAEECDDGAANSDDTPDACRTSCLRARCGDGVVDGGESCDQGLANSDLVPDACRTDCAPARCGDTIVDLAAGEICDDGNSADGDGCSGGCALEFCGNGVLEAGEVCDDGNAETGDGCTPDCLSDETCGNGRPDFAAGESCDCGTDPADLPPGCDAPNGDPAGACDASCFSLFCGNGVIEGNEVCDDGNTAEGDGCSPDCLSDETCGNGRPDFIGGETCDCGTDPGNLPPGCDGANGDPAGSCGTGCRIAFCGNGVVDLATAEVCDDGNNLSGDGCSADCRSDETCGNGYVDGGLGELCDDGNLLDGDACSANCTLPSCGDGVLDPGEVCDDGNNAGGDGCNARCSSVEICGNGIVDALAGEQCDDGNTVGGDGCSAQCRLPFCGNGVVDSAVGEVCDDGNNVDLDGCSSDCRSDESCGNGVVDIAAGEQCDDGNSVGGDGCDATCALEAGWSCSSQPSNCGPLCGDGLLIGAEPCDGADLGGNDCTTVPGGFTGGTLACLADCSGFDVSGCGSCGDGVVDAGEACDCGLDPGNLPAGCTAINGQFAGECDQTCSGPACNANYFDLCDPIHPGPCCDDSFGAGQTCADFGGGLFFCQRACQTTQDCYWSNVCGLQAAGACGVQTCGPGWPDTNMNQPCLVDTNPGFCWPQFTRSDPAEAQFGTCIEAGSLSHGDPCDASVPAGQRDRSLGQCNNGICFTGGGGPTCHQFCVADEAYGVAIYGDPPGTEQLPCPVGSNCRSEATIDPATGVTQGRLAFCVPEVETRSCSLITNQLMSNPGQSCGDILTNGRCDPLAFGGGAFSYGTRIGACVAASPVTHAVWAPCDALNPADVCPPGTLCIEEDAMTAAIGTQRCVPYCDVGYHDGVTATCQGLGAGAGAGCVSYSQAFNPADSIPTPLGLCVVP